MSGEVALMTVRSAAAMVELSESEVRQAIQEGSLSAVRIGGEQMLRVDAAELREWAQRAQAARPAIGPCPAWCTLPGGHGWDGLLGPERRLARIHQGPRYGSAVSVIAQEYAGSDGHLEAPRVDVCTDEDRDPMEVNDLVGQLQEAVAWVHAQRRGERWWVTASNPACRPWCQRTHEADEFTRGASLVCERLVDVGDRGVVRLTQVTEADERIGASAGTLTLVPASIEVEVGMEWSDYGDGLWSLESAAALADDLPAALREALVLVDA